MKIYEKFSDKLKQGDILIPTDEDYKEIYPDKLPGIVGIIIISNSCDIKNDNIKFIAVAPIIPLEYAVSTITKKKKDERKSPSDIKHAVEKGVENIMGYNNKVYFYLPKNRYYKIRVNSIVILEMSIPRELKEVRDIMKESRVCSLKNPWREKLGWCVGNLYNRVAVEDYSSSHKREVLSRFRV